MTDHADEQLVAVSCMALERSSLCSPVAASSGSSCRAELPTERDVSPAGPTLNADASRMANERPRWRRLWAWGTPTPGP